MTEERIDWRKYPNIRQTGRYAFFALLSFGSGTFVGALVVAVGLSRDLSMNIAGVVGIASFMALRDMSMGWNWALKVQAKAIEEEIASLPLAKEKQIGDG